MPVFVKRVRPHYWRKSRCRHPRTVLSQECSRGGGNTDTPGGACNHNEVCLDCGRRVGTESWNLAIGQAAHDKKYGG